MADELNPPLPDVAEMVKELQDCCPNIYAHELCCKAAAMLKQQAARIAELEALTRAEYDERGRLWAIINAYERGDKVSPYAPTTIPESMVLVPESALKWLFEMIDKLITVTVLISASIAVFLYVITREQHWANLGTLSMLMLILKKEGK